MKVYLRDATEQDRDMLFEWANDEEVRKKSFSSQKIFYEEHCIWFDKMMQDEHCVQWILQADEQAVGQIRLTLDGEIAEVGYSISAERRGEGFGKLMLMLATQRVQEKLPAVKKIIAKVKPSNIASLKAFEDNGYKALYEYLELEIDKNKDSKELNNCIITHNSKTVRGGYYF